MLLFQQVVVLLKILIINGGNLFKLYIHRCKMVLLLGMLICFSCCAEYAVETEKKTSDYVTTRSITFPSLLTDFFSHSCNGLDSVINTLKNIDREKNFIGSFLKKYGIPLWNYTLILDGDDEVSFYVPLYQGKSLLSIDALWFFHISDGIMTYAPFRRTDERIKNHEQRFIFDLLSWHVFGESNSSGLVFKEKESSSRAWIVTERCWDVYTGTGEQLEYKYTNCVQNAYWVIETNLQDTTSPEDGFADVSVPIGAGGFGSGSGFGSASVSAGDIFSNENFTEETWNMVDCLLEEVLEDCMGEALFNGIKEKLNGDKITLRFIENGSSGYKWKNRTLSMSVDQLESHVLFHEMFHLYQTLSEAQFTFENYLLNREIETHYAQYLFRKKQAFLFDVETDFVYITDNRLHACRLLEDYIDDYGVISNGSNLLTLEEHLEFVVTDAFHKYGYANYPFDYESFEQTFGILKELANNCKP